MMRITAILIFSLLCGRSHAQRQASRHDFNKELSGYMASFLSNPALQFLNPDSTYTDLSVNLGLVNAGGLYMTEGGDKSENVSFNVHSFNRKDATILYGGAGYENRSDEHVNWNSVADYQLVAPYIVADTTGGTSKQEYYSFFGGYAHQWSNKTFGIGAEYRAGESYRTLDPRPKSTISDFSVNAGMAFKLTDYQLAAGAMYSTYKQELDINVYRPGGGNKVFYMKGFGICDENFSTVISSNDNLGNYYDLNAWKLSMQLFPRGNGYFSAINFRHGTLNMKDGNQDNAYTLYQLNTNEYYAEIGRLYIRQKVHVKIKGYGGFLHKKGSEYNYAQSLTVLSVAQKYSQRELSGGIDCFVSSTHAVPRQYFIKAGIGYFSYHAQYKLPSPDPKAYQEFGFISTDLTAGINKHYLKSAMTIKISMRYDHCLDKKYREASLATAETLRSAVIPDFEYLTAKKINLSPQVRYDIDLKGNYGLYVTARQFNEFYIGDKPKTGLNIAIGLTL